MDSPITRAEHEEFARRIEAVTQRLEAEDNRQNQRLAILESDILETRKLATSVQTLATNMESMVKEQERQGKRLETLENRDGEMWRKVTGYVLTAVVGAVLALIFTHIGLTI